MTKRFLAIVAVFVVCAGGTYYFLKPNPKAQSQKALSCVKENNFSAAEKVLGTLRSESVGYPLSLYRGYLAQMRGRYHDADLLFQNALNERPREDALVDLALARAANAYYVDRDQEIPHLLATATRYSSRSPFLSFFEGLASYLRAHYGEALRAWDTYSPTELEKEEWMGVVLERLFPSSWQQIHVAHCLTEEGSVLNGREILEKEARRGRIDDQELENLSNLFLGLTYLKESHQIPLDQRESFYKLARFYFDRSGSLDRYPRERERVINHIRREVEALLLTDLEDNQRKWGLDFVHTLQDWKAGEAVDMLAAHLAEKMAQDKGPENVVLCAAVRNEFQGSVFHKALTEKLLKTMARELTHGDADDLFAVWAMVENLSDAPRLAAKQMASLTTQEILSAVEHDDNSLKKTRHFIAFWEKLGRNPRQRLQLANDLLFHAKVLWQSGGFEKKGLRLMEVAWNLSNRQHNLGGEIETFLTDLYIRAENSNLIDRLSMIYDAMEHFNISRGKLVSPSKLANHLADADYLYHSRNYSSAKANAGWVLKLDPYNDEALRLVGLAAFHLGEYSCALTTLQRLDNPDESAQKALMLSQVFASQQQEKHLAQIDNTDTFDDDE